MKLPVYYSVRGMSLPRPLARRLLIKQLQVLKHVSFIITIIIRNKLVVRVIQTNRPRRLLRRILRPCESNRPNIDRRPDRFGLGFLRPAIGASRIVRTVDKRETMTNHFHFSIATNTPMRLFGQSS